MTAATTRTFDASTPSPARVRDYWLGGHDNFQADRDMAARLLAVWPQPKPGRTAGPRELALRSREFLTRATTWTARQGISQFADFNCGFPVPSPLKDTHEAARDGRTGARCVYIDSDPMVISHDRALLAGDGVEVLQADSADPAAILAAGLPGFDLGQPCGLVFGMMTHRMPAGQAQEVIGAYLAAVPAGSYLIISTLQCGDPDWWDRVSCAYAAGKIFNHPPSEVERFFAGTQLVPPGLTTAKAWRPGFPDARLGPDAPMHALCGVGVKE